MFSENNNMLPTHQDIQNRLQILNYDPTTEGVCMGLSRMGMQAALIDEFDIFIQRLLYIKTIPLEDFKSHMEYLDKKRIETVHQIKNHWQEEYKTLKENNFKSFKMDDFSKEIKNKVKQLLKKLLLSSESSEKQVLDKSLFNLILQERIKNAIKNHKNQGISLDIRIFLEGLSIYQGRKFYTYASYPYFHSILKNAAAQEYEPANLLVMSKRLEDLGGATCVYHFTGLYDKVHLAKHFSILKKILLSHLENFPIVFEIRSINHCTFIFFNFQPKPSWTFVDINNLQLTLHPFDDEDSLAENIIKAFAINHEHYIGIDTRFYTLNINALFIRKVITQNILTDKSWQLIHDPNYLINLDPEIPLEQWLLIAATSNDSQKIKELISIKKLTSSKANNDQYYINVNYQAEELSFPVLSYAAASNSSEALKLLLSHPEIDTNVKDKNGKTPFGYAVLCNALDSVKLFSKHKNFNIEIDFQNSLWDAMYSQYKDLLIFLLKYPLVKNKEKYINSLGFNEKTLLIYAVQYNDLDITTILLENGALTNYQDNKGLTALHYAVFNKNTEIVSILQKYAANPNIVDNQGINPLMLAVFQDNISLVESLILMGADINAINYDDQTTLHIATLEGNLPMVKYLLTRLDMDVNLFDKNNQSALMIAIMNGYKEIAKCLILDKRSNLLLKNKKNQSALECAEFFNIDLHLAIKNEINVRANQSENKKRHYFHNDKFKNDLFYEAKKYSPQPKFNQLIGCIKKKKTTK